MSTQESNEKKYFSWLKKKIPASQYSVVEKNKNAITALLLQKRVLRKPLFLIDDAEEISKNISKVPSCFSNVKLRSAAVQMVTMYATYLTETNATEVERSEQVCRQTSTSAIEDLLSDDLFAPLCAELSRQNIEDGGWQARAGGRILQQGENRVNEHVDNDRMVFTIANARQKWMDVSPIIGTVVESNANHYLVKTKQGLINMICKESGNEQTITISPISILDRYTISSLRSVANKVAYCIGCKACMPQCPTGAFQIIEGKITIRENACIHCSNCCTYTDRGCLVAKSLYVRSNSMKNPDRYRNFGFRRAFYVIRAIGIPAEYAKGTIRVSFGRENTKEISQVCN